MTDRFALRGLLAIPLAIGMAACSSTQVDTGPSPAVAGTPTTDTIAVGVPAGANAPMPGDTVAVAADTADTTGNVSGYRASGVPQAGAPEAGGMTHTVPLTAVNNSGFTGNAVFTDLGGGKTRVAFTLNAPANVNTDDDHDVRIHTGTCEAPGPEVADLDDADANGMAFDSEVEFSMSTLMDGNHIIAADETNGDRLVACAAIPSSGM